MGLDMYLYATQYLCGTDWMGKDKNSESYKEKVKADKIRSMFPEMYKSGYLNSVEVQFEVGYWRKANQIHKWFVDNVQNGVDECQHSHVKREDLEKLLALCKEALKSKYPEKILPTQGGFFFGNREYDEYYKQDIEDTIKIIEKALKLPNSYKFKYHSSW